MTQQMAQAGAMAPAAGAGVRVWDPVVRLFHWTVVAGCVLNLFVLEDGELPHEIVGYVVAAALVVRFVWGSSARSMRVSRTSCRRPPA